MCCYFYHISIGELITAFITFFIFLVAWIQLTKISKTTKTDFIVKYEEGFFGDENKIIIQALEDKELSMKLENKNTDEEKVVFNIKGKDYESNDFDIVIGYFETIGYLEKKGRLEIDLVYELFEYYIRKFWEFATIGELNYIEWSRTGDTPEDNSNKDVYNYFEYIYYKLQMYRADKTKSTILKGKKLINHLGTWLWWWKIKYCVRYKIFGANVIPET